MDAVKRILVLGCCGAGKSTFARRLGEKLGLPVFHLDRLFWRLGWKKASREEFDAELGRILKKDEWILDGNYKRTLPERLKYADGVVFLRYPRSVCLWRVLKRRLEYACPRRKPRPDAAPGCPERLTPDFLRFIWDYNREMLPRVLADLENASCRVSVLQFRHPREAERYLLCEQKDSSMDR